MTPQRILDYYPSPIEGSVIEPGSKIYCRGKAGVSPLEIVPGECSEELLVVKVTTATGIGGFLSLSRRSARVMTYSFVGMAYCNLVFGFMRGATGAKGYTLGGNFANEVTAIAGMLGVPLAIIALLLVLVGALKFAKGEQR